MKICLVTTFPPSQGGLSEYGFHIAQELKRNPFLSLTILADEMSPPAPELDGFCVQRCWKFDDPANSVRILRTLDQIKPDVVWFNLLFSTFGRNPLVAFSGLMIPLLARLKGHYTHVTLHHLMDTVDLKDAGIRFARTYRLAGAFATRLLLLSNSVSVLMPGYRKILDEKYGGDNVHVRSHGILTRRPEYPDFTRRGNPEHRILAFGKWGTYKRLELMIQAFDGVKRSVPNAKLVIAGGDHPQAAGYVESMKEQCAGDPQIHFTGYVHEDELPNLFQSASVAVMPYSSSTGCSGVAHLACAYGVPIVCADLPDFQQMAEGEELAVEFYKAGNAQDLADCLIRFLEDSDKQQAMAEQNFGSALRMTMPNIVQKYLRHFELHQRTEALRQVSRFRRLPAWVPSKSLLLRAMTRNTLSWAHRSAMVVPRSKRVNGQYLSIDGDGDHSRKLSGVGTPVNGNGIGAGVAGRRPVFAERSDSSAREGKKDRGQGENHPESLNHQEEALPSALPIAHQGETESPDGQESTGVDQLPSTMLPILTSNGNGGNGKPGADRSGTGSNGHWGEGTAQIAGEAAAGEGDGVIEGSRLGRGRNREAS
jgi:glycosyltransferase involved in cell wall biosynthesis